MRNMNSTFMKKKQLAEKIAKLNYVYVCGNDKSLG